MKAIHVFRGGGIRWTIELPCRQPFQHALALLGPEMPHLPTWQEHRKTEILELFPVLGILKDGAVILICTLRKPQGGSHD